MKGKFQGVIFDLDGVLVFQGKVYPGAAELLAFLRENATYIGKPNRYVFEMALKTMDIEKGKALMVGDKITTDVVGAKKAGIRSVLIKTGEFKERDLDCDIKPDYIFDSIKDVKKLFE